MAIAGHHSWSVRAEQCGQVVSFMSPAHSVWRSGDWARLLMRLHPTNHVFRSGSQVCFGGRKVSVPEMRLNVDDGDRRVGRKPNPPRMAEIVQRPVRAELLVDSQQDRPERLVSQRAQWVAERQPQRSSWLKRWPFVCEIAGQPSQGIPRHRHPARLARAFADEPYALVTPIDVLPTHTKHLGSARAAGNEEAHDRSVPVASQGGEELLKVLVWNAPRNALFLLLSIHSTWTRPP